MSNPDENSILRLPDDCFYHIYSFLPIRDWSSLRDTCTRLRTVSDYCFQRQSETFQLSSENVSGSYYDLLLVKDVKHLMRTFGQFITKLSINSNAFDDCVNPGELVPFLNRYCSALQDLKLVKINLSAGIIRQCDRLFTNLNRLVIDQSMDNETTFTDCMARCTTLNELEMIRLDNITGNGLANHRLECLTSFTMSGCSHFNYQFFQEFLRKNIQLTRIKILSPPFPITNLIDDLATSLTSLMELSVKGSIAFHKLNVTPVTRMHSLKKIELDCLLITDDLIHLLLTGLSTLAHFDHLHLASVRLTDITIERLYALKNLKTLTLTATNNLHGEICQKLATELNGLSEIQFIQCEHTTFDDVQEFVARLTNLIRIVFIPYNGDNAEPLLTKDMFVSIVGIRNREAVKEMLKIFLKDDDLYSIRNEFEWIGMPKILSENSNVVQLLPLEDEHIRTFYEFGTRTTRGPHRCDDVFSSYDEQSDDDYMFDDESDDF